MDQKEVSEVYKMQALKVKSIAIKIFVSIMKSEFTRS